MGATDLWVLFDHKDANRGYWAYEFTSRLSRAEQDARWNIALGNLPLRPVEKSMKAFTEAVASQPGLEIFVDNLDNVRCPRPTVKGYVGLSSALGATVARIIQGQGDPRAELERRPRRQTRPSPPAELRGRRPDLSPDPHPPSGSRSGPGRTGE